MPGAERLRAGPAASSAGPFCGRSSAITSSPGIGHRHGRRRRQPRTDPEGLLDVKDDGHDVGSTCGVPECGGIDRPDHLVEDPRISGREGGDAALAGVDALRGREGGGRRYETVTIGSERRGPEGVDADARRGLGPIGEPLAEETSPGPCPRGGGALRDELGERRVGVVEGVDVVGQGAVESGERRELRRR